MPNLEEKTIEHLPERCANCGARLTDAEKQHALELEMTPVLCSNCTAEQEPSLAPEEELEL